MALDPKKLAEWKGRVTRDVADGPRGDDWPADVVAALIAEVERLSATLAPKSFAEAAEQLGGDSLEREQIFAALQAAWRDGRGEVERLQEIERHARGALELIGDRHTYGPKSECPGCELERLLKDSAA